MSFDLAIAGRPSMVSSVPWSNFFDLSCRKVFAEFDDGSLPKGLHEVEVDL